MIRLRFLRNLQAVESTHSRQEGLGVHAFVVPGIR
jgi:hypothetical protein